MDNTNKGKDHDEEVHDPAVAEALARGRNANDNFPSGETDDYGTEGDEEEQSTRDRIKGGAGQHGMDRNRNDDFENDKQDQP